MRSRAEQDARMVSALLACVVRLERIVLVLLMSFCGKMNVVCPADVPALLSL